jgi:hypothetical protein
VDLANKFGGLRGFVQQQERVIDSQLNGFGMFAAKEKLETSTTIAALNRDRAELDKARADAQNAAAQATSQLSALRTAIEERGPRTITAQRAKLVALLSPSRIPKPKIVVNSLLTDPEAAQFGEMIIDALRAAGYTVSEAAFGNRSLGYSRPGAFMWVRSLKNQPKGAGSLQVAFKRIGISMGAEQHPLASDVPDENTVVLAISSHP